MLMRRLGAGGAVRSRRKDETGQAMLVVLAALALFAAVPLTVIATAANQLPLTTRNLYWNAAYEAGQAGLNNYVQQLDANESYVEYSKSNPDGNAAFTGWVQVAGTTNPPEYYEYATKVAKGGLQLTVSGKAGFGVAKVIRNFTWSLTPTSTLSDIYWTACESSSACGATSQIVFTSSDVLNGPVFSDDDFSICGDPTFNSTVQSANAGGVGSPYWTSTCLGTKPVFNDGAPTYAPAQNIIANGVGGDVAPAQNFGCDINNSGGTTTFTLNSGTLSWSGGTLDTADGNKGAGCTSPVTLAGLQSDIFYVNGNIQVSGNVSGFLTLVSSGNITVTGSIAYPSADIQGGSGSPQSDTSDALGLIAEDNVLVSDNNAATTVDAAMMAITGSFENADYTSSCSGTCPTLTVFGSIAQNIRGPVGEQSGGTPTNGYQKSYWYDYSFAYLWPPFFIPPASATWNEASYAELLPGAANEAIPGT